MAAPETWQVGNGCNDVVAGPCGSESWPVQYCLSEPAEPHCKLHFSRAIAITVIIVNFCEFRTLHATVCALCLVHMAASLRYRKLQDSRLTLR